MTKIKNVAHPERMTLQNFLLCTSGRAWLKHLEVKMIGVKALAIVVLLVGGTSLALAQNGPATGYEPPVAGGAAGNPILDAQGLEPRLVTRRDTTEASTCRQGATKAQR
jgi:hypothetical protein